MILLRGKVGHCRRFSPVALKAAGLFFCANAPRVYLGGFTEPCPLPNSLLSQVADRRVVREPHLFRVRVGATILGMSRSECTWT